MSAAAACVPSRLLYTVMASLGLMAMSTLRLNTSMGIVAMVNHTALGQQKQLERPRDADECPGSADEEEDGPFAWSEPQQGVVLGAYFVGYLLSQLPGAWLAQRVGGKWVLLGAIAVNVGCSVGVPAAAASHLGYQAVAALRLVQGFFAGLSFPCVVMMTARWSPSSERSVISGIVYAGFSLGVVLTNLLAGLIAERLGWPWVFYAPAVAFVPWLVVWAACVADRPARCRFISRRELEYILADQGHDLQHGAKHRFPWRAAAAPGPFWALLFCITCNDAAWYLCQTYTPKFMKDVLHRNLSQNALWSTLPFVLNFLVSMVLGPLVDYWRNSDVATTTTARQVVVAIGGLVPGACFLAIPHIGCAVWKGVALITVAVAAMGTNWVGLVPNHIDLAPNFAGMLMGISNTATAVPGFLVPLALGALTSENNTLEQWGIMFSSVAVILFLMTLVFCLFASGEVQPWNSPEEVRSEDPSPGTSQQDPSKGAPLIKT